MNSATSSTSVSSSATTPARLRITAGGHVFIAEAHPDAPLTVAAFMTLLPYRQKLIHVRWSGEGCWVPLGDWKLAVDGTPVGFENHTSHPSAGDILFYPGGYSETEIIVAYGACSFASKLGPLAGNHFLTIVEGKENLRALGVKTLWEGAQGRGVRTRLSRRATTASRVAVGPANPPRRPRASIAPGRSEVGEAHARSATLAAMEGFARRDGCGRSRPDGESARRSPAGRPDQQQCAQRSDGVAVQQDQQRGARDAVDDR